MLKRYLVVSSRANLVKTLSLLASEFKTRCQWFLKCSLGRQNSAVDILVARVRVGSSVEDSCVKMDRCPFKPLLDLALLHQNSYQPSERTSWPSVMVAMYPGGHLTPMLLKIPARWLLAAHAVAQAAVGLCC